MSRVASTAGVTIAKRRPAAPLGDSRLDRLASAVAEVRAGARSSPRTFFSKRKGRSPRRSARNP